MHQFPIHCPPRRTLSMAPSVKDLMLEYANAVGQYKPPQPNAHMVIPTIPIGRITPTSPGNPILLPMCPLVPNHSLVPHINHQPPPSSSPVEQAILNLSKVVGNFVEEQKGINVQLAQRIDTVESTPEQKNRWA